MKAIVPLIRIVHSYLKNETLLDQFSDHEMKIYKGVVKGNIVTDRDASMLLFNKNVNHPAYKKFKTSFKNNLYICLNQLEFVKGNDFQKIRFKIANRYSLIKKLITLGKSKLAMPIIKRTMKEAMKYSLNVEAFDLSRYLCRYYGQFEDNVAGSKELYDLGLKLHHLIAVEARIEYYYADIICTYKKNRFNSKSLAKKAEEYCKEFEKDNLRDSHRFSQYFYMLKVMSYSLVGEYLNALKTLQEAINHFESLYPFCINSINCFRWEKIRILIRQNEFNEARAVLALTIENSTHDFAYFRNKELDFLLAIRTKDYYLAEEICNSVIKDKRFPYEQNVRKDVWELFSLYILVLIPERGDKYVLKRLHAFRKDKKGMNLAVIIGELLYWHKTGQDEMIYNRMRNINNYINKHLRENSNIRSKIFLKMLMHLPKKYFVTVKFLQKTNTLLEELKSNPLDLSTQSSDVEIIPYEDLWEMLTVKRKAEAGR